MVKVPKIAVFRGEQSDYASLMSIFSRHTYSVRTLSSIEEFSQVAEQEGAPCDAAVFWLHSASDPLASKLADAPSPIVRFILEIRSHAALCATPIVVLYQGGDRPMIQTLYGAGADCVIRGPFDPDLVYQQISAFARIRRAHSEALKSHSDALSFHSPILWALNCAREGIIVFDKHEALFANQSARVLLGLDTPEKLSAIGEQFQPFLKPSTSKQSYAQFSAPARTQSLARSDGQRFIAHVRCIPLHGESSTGESGTVVGYAVGILDASERGDLSTLLAHAKKLQSVALLAYGGALNWLRLISKRASTKPIDELRAQLALEARSADYGGVILALLEALDLVLNPGVEVRVEYDSDFKVAVRFTDLLQILGCMVFQAIEHSGSVGDALIRAECDATTATITVQSESRRITPYLPDDFMSSLLQGMLGDPASEENSIPIGLIEAQKIAYSYGASIDFKKINPLLKMRIKLPLVAA